MDEESVDLESDFEDGVAVFAFAVFELDEFEFDFEEDLDGPWRA